MGFKELLKDSVTEMFTYRTTKLVKTNDKFLVTLHFIFMSLIGTFALVSIILSHNYMVFELPTLYTFLTYKDWSLSPTSVDRAYNVEIASNSTVRYCKPGYVNWRRGGKIFDNSYMSNVKCVAHFLPAEYVWPFQDGRGLEIGTFQEVVTVKRTCLNAGAGVSSSQDDCDGGNSSTTVAYMNAGAERMSIPFDIRFQTRSGSLNSVDVVYVGASAYETATQTPMTSISDLLLLAGINSLDEENPFLKGERGTLDQNQPPTGLPYRISGLRLIVRVEFKNAYFNAPLKKTTQATLAVEQVPADFFNARTNTLYQVGPEGSDFTSTRTFHTWACTTLAFVAAGEIGKFDLFALALAVTNAFVLIGMATTIVDVVGVMSSETFLDDKYEDDGERLGLEMMLANIENDDHPGVPFDPNDLRLKDASGEPGLSYEKTIEQLMEEVREIQEQLSLLPEDENELRLITTGHREAEEHRKLRLVYMPDPLSAEANDKKYVPPEILLHEGMQTIGRGMGGIENKGVSRQQFSIAVIKERIRMKSLRDGPGVWRQNTGRWQMLQLGKSAVLNVGDRLCFRMREGKLGGHEGVFALDYQDTKVQCTVFGIPFQ